MDPVRRDSNKTGKIFLLIVAVGIYCAFKIAYPYIRNFQVQKAAQAAVQMLANPPISVNAQSYDVFINNRIAQLELPLEVEDFVVSEEGKELTMTVDWETTVVFIPANPVFEEVSYVFQFHNEATATKSK